MPPQCGVRGSLADYEYSTLLSICSLSQQHHFILNTLTHGLYTPACSTVCNVVHHYNPIPRVTLKPTQSMAPGATMIRTAEEKAALREKVVVD